MPPFCDAAVMWKSRDGMEGWDRGALQSRGRAHSGCPSANLRLFTDPSLDPPSPYGSTGVPVIEHSEAGAYLPEHSGILLSSNHTLGSVDQS